MVHFEGQEWMYSLAVSSTSLSNVVVGPVLGILYDRTHASKLLVVFSLASAALGMSAKYLSIFIVVYLQEHFCILLLCRHTW